MNHNTEPHYDQRSQRGPRTPDQIERLDAPSINHVASTGTVATEPRCRHGLAQPAVGFRLAVSPPDPADPLYVDIVCLLPVSRFAAEAEVGDHLAVLGRLDHHEWVADDGIRRARWQIIAREMVLLRPRTHAA